LSKGPKYYSFRHFVIPIVPFALTFLIFEIPSGDNLSGSKDSTTPATIARGWGVSENNYSTDGQIAINRQIDVRKMRVNAHTMVCGRSVMTNRVRSSV
jgi:hypothetical protein